MNYFEADYPPPWHFYQAFVMAFWLSDCPEFMTWCMS